MGLKDWWDKYSIEYKQNYDDLNFQRYGTRPQNTKKYFYYDESDNIRNFNIKKGCYNADYFSQFTLGGIVSVTPIDNSKLEVLYDELSLQESVRELKSHNILNKKRVGIAQFDSKKLNIFLNYLLKSDYYLHYTTINVLYYGVVVDIIDSLIEFDKNNHLFYYTQPKVDSLKACLYKCIFSDAGEWGKILSELNFPNLNLESKKAFLFKLSNSLNKFNDYEYELQRKELLDLIKEFPKDKKMIFLSDEKDLILIEGFDTFYLHKVFIYDNSKHYFDEEPEINKIFKEKGIESSNIAKRFEFVDSYSMKPIQISDICSRVICVLYRFLASMNLYQIKNYIKELDHKTYEYKNLKLLAELINKTVRYDEHLILQMSNDIELEKYNLFCKAF